MALHSGLDRSSATALVKAFRKRQLAEKLAVGKAYQHRSGCRWLLRDEAVRQSSVSHFAERLVGESVAALAKSRG